VKRNRRGMWVGLGGAAATFIGALLPWVNGPFGISASGTTGDGILAIILSVPMAIFAWLMISRRWASIATIAFSVLTVAMMSFEVVHISSAAYSSQVGVSIGIGVIVCFAGGVAGLIGGTLGRRDFVRVGAGYAPSSPPPPPSGTPISPDGQWWWDGYQWQPRFSPPARERDAAALRRAAGTETDADRLRARMEQRNRNWDDRRS
jgi:hypothetical protein